jgi:uncharacterized protein (DUF2147 family)
MVALRPRVILTLFAAVIGLWLSMPLVAQDLSPEGRWQTIDDKTGVAKSVVVITVVNGEVVGSVEEVYAPPSPSTHPLCEKCPGDRKDKPIVGMRIMWGLKKDGDEFTGGRVFDPEDGKTYRCKIRVVDGGQKLEVRGFIGLSMFGRTQTWKRL